jgi:RHS repeat-associated protein
MVQELGEHGSSSYVYSPDSPYTPLARLDVGASQTIAAAAAQVAIDRAAQSSASTVQAPPRVFHFHTDLVGAPLEVTDEEGELAWAGRYQAWGKVERAEREALGRRIDQPLRFAGQYADDSTGLHYNTFRYYDPDVGRFISQDPIGLAGGENLYAYAPNPSGWVDPLGWCGTPSCQVPAGYRHAS